MKLALLTNFIPPYRKALFSEIATRCELKVFVSTDMEPNRRWAVDTGGLPVVRQRSVVVPVVSHHPSGFPDLGFLHVPFDTIQKLAVFRPDAIISAEFGIRSLQAALFKVLRPRTFLALWATLSERSEEGRGSVRRRIRKWLLARADAVLVNGSSGKRYVQSFGVDPARIHILPYALASSSLPEPNPKSSCGPRRLLYTGQLIPRKGVLRFTRALASWLDRNRAVQVRFDIVGDGEEREALAALNLPLNLEITIRESVPHDQICRLVAGAHATVYPTLADEWGMIAESLSVGVPVLGSVHSQAVVELIRTGVNGWAYDPEVPGSAEEAIAAACLTGTEKLTAMTEDCRDSVRHLDPIVIAEATVSLVSQRPSTRRRAALVGSTPNPMNRN